MSINITQQSVKHENQYPLARVQNVFTVRLLQKMNVLGMTLNHIWWWGSSSEERLLPGTL